jgi:hypothetical protein
MALTPVDRERIQDSKRKIQSITHSLRHVAPDKIANLEAIQECLEDADRSLDGALKHP